MATKKKSARTHVKTRAKAGKKSSPAGGRRAGGKFEAVYKVDFQKAGWQKDWTVFDGYKVVEPRRMQSGVLVHEAYLNRVVDPGAVRVSYEAQIDGPNAAGQISDLSLHIGPVTFCFGGSLNTFTGVRGGTLAPGKSAHVKDAPLIVTGKRHRVTCELIGTRARTSVDGRAAGELALNAPLTDGALSLYSWAGSARFFKVTVEAPVRRELAVARNGRWQREALRLHLSRQSITWIEHKGKFLHECSLPGEGRDLNVYPAHPNGIQLAKDRFLLLYSTRAYRGDDDEKSGIYQLRAGGFDGPILKEGWIVRTRDDWDPLRDGKKYVLQNGHPVAFGVPRGALIQGKRVAHENIFAVVWRREARWIDPATGFMPYVQEHPELTEKTNGVEWAQFRLNDAGDDIEILKEGRLLRQVGYESGPDICEQPNVRMMRQTYVLPSPINAEHTEWSFVDNFWCGKKEDVKLSCQIAPLRFRFNTATRLYEWVQTGKIFGEGVFEASLVPYRGDWVIAARRWRGDGVSWGRTSDLFGPPPEMKLHTEQPNIAPMSVFLCPDGIIRRAGSASQFTPHGPSSVRDPICLIDIDPEDDFRASNERNIFDARSAGLPVPSGPIVDFPKLLPHTGGSTQLVLHRLRSGALNDPADKRKGVSQIEMDVSGIYWAKVHYRESWPAVWRFEGA